MQRTIIRFLLICLLLGLLISPPAPTSASTHSDTLLSGQYESQYGGTTIWLKLCGQGASYRFRSEQLPSYAQLWDGTYGAINGCLGFSYRAVIGAQPGSQYLIYSMVMDSPLSTTDFLQRARADICTVNAPDNVSCSRLPRTLPEGYIDQPADGQTVQGNVTVSGWAIDRTAMSGTGVSEVHVYANAGSDTFLGAASYGQARTDVAGTYGDTRFTNSGFSLTFDSHGLPNGSVTLKVAMKSTESGEWSWKTWQITVGNPGTVPPNKPTPLAPGNGAHLNTRTVTIQWQDAGDPDNAPRTYRDYQGEIRKSDSSWSTSLNWQTATSWTLTVPDDGTYIWHVQSGDGAVGSGWSSDWSFTVGPPTAVTHTNTQLSATVENGKTTILMKICGSGPTIRFISELKGTGDTSQQLGDWTRGAVANSCSPGYRPAIGADFGAQIRFYSTVLDQNISVADFRARARKDVCKVTGLGQITCEQRADWFPEDGKQPCSEPGSDPVACLNLIFPLPLPARITPARNPAYHDGYSVDFLRDGAKADTVPVLATHDGYLNGYPLNDGAWCAWVSTLPNKDDPNSYTSAYCHVTANSIPKDKIGKKIHQGEQIALMGLTGNTTGLHVHYDLTHNGKTIPPVPMCGIRAFITGETHSTCKTMPTQAQANISPGATSSLSVLLNPAASIANAPQAIGATNASDDFTFQFPAGVVQTPLSAEFTELFAPTQAVSDQVEALRYFRLDAYDAQFNPTAQLDQPYTAVINYTDAEIAALSINEASLNLRFYNGSSWVSLLPCEGCTVDMVNNRVTVSLNHFGEFALVGTIERKVFLPITIR